MPDNNHLVPSILEGMTIETLCAAIVEKSKRHPPRARGITVQKSVHHNDLYYEFLNKMQKHFNGHFKNIDKLNNPSCISWLRKAGRASAAVDKAKKKLVALDTLLRTIEEGYTQSDALTGFTPDPIHNEVAKALVKQATQYAKNCFVAWDFDQAQTYLEDTADVLQLAQAIYLGQLKTAKRYSRLDTIVRDDIPEVAWTWIQENLR